MKHKTLIIASLLTGLAACFVAHSIMDNCNEGVLLVDADDNTDSICSKLGVNAVTWKVLSMAKPMHVRTGRYVITEGTSVLSAYRRIRNNQQDAINLVILEHRTIDQLISNISSHMMADSASFTESLNDKELCDSLGFNKETLPAMFIPNTYQVWWNESPKAFMCRMHREWKRFWNDERKLKAHQIGFSPIEVHTLASIVDEETNYAPEKPRVAGMYINRLSTRMPLQADPTVKFALKDFGIRRILHKHLEIDSPYNTYKYAGLPPGPIRIAQIATLDAVLNYERHTYFYMCAKEDFSGSHNFASTYTQHLQNARRYQQALNKRGIK